VEGEGKHVWVCVGTYNERDNLGRLLEELREHVPEGHAVVVDDNSPDGTGEILDGISERDARVHPIHREGKLGYASAHRTAIAYALKHGAETVVTMDADFSHDPAHIPALLAGIETGADVAIGSRYVAGGRTENWPWYRVALSSTANALARAGLGLSVSDCTSGFRAYRGSLLTRLRLDQLRSEGYSFLEEILVACQLANARMMEVPIVFVERRAGRSKLSRRVILEAAWMLAKLTWRRTFARRAMTRALVIQE